MALDPSNSKRLEQLALKGLNARCDAVSLCEITAVDAGVQQVHAIRPAYIVLAGLGAGNLLLVIIAIVIICNYPLNRGQPYKNGGGAVGGGGGGGHDVEEDHEMTSKDDHRYSEIDQQQQQQQQQHDDYSEDNDINDRRYTSPSYDDEPPMSVEENPYFNKGEIEASAAF